MSKIDFKSEILLHTEMLKEHVSNNEYALQLIHRIEDMVKKLTELHIRKPRIPKSLPPTGTH